MQDSFFENDLRALAAVTSYDSVHHSHYSSPNFAVLMQILLQNIRVVVHQKSRSKLKVFEDSGSILGESTSDCISI
ncbi:hypothetical protein MXB_2072 [Myxobolus squamalis]|nr:hypothetical protein MXB_2072 [Myxobolus squamalis]